VNKDATLRSERSLDVVFIGNVASLRVHADTE